MAFKRVAALALATLLMIGSALLGRMLYSAREELTAAEEAAARGDHEATDRHLRRAIAHYAPGNVWVSSAAKRLLQRAELAESQGKRALALRRYRDLRSALLALRPFSLSDVSLSQLEARMATLSRAPPQPKDDQAVEAAPRQTPLSAPQPNPGWTLVGLMGFLLWIGSAFALIAFGFNPDLTLLRGRFWGILVAVICGLGLFALGMAMA